MKTRNPFQTARHTISKDSKAVPALVFLALLLPGWSLPLLALESPTSDGPVSQLDGPVFRIPLMRKRPAIDGKFSVEEWEDSSALTGFWSSNCREPETLRPA